MFYVIMAIAGLLTEGIFQLFHGVPTTRHLAVTSAHFQWNYTTYLNLLFLCVAAVVWWLSRQQKRLGGGKGYAIDPVCGMQVRKESAPAQASVGHKHYYFCSDRCRERFEAQPEKYTSGTAKMDHVDGMEGMRGMDGMEGMEGTEGMSGHDGHGALADSAVDPVCGMTVNPATAAAHRSYEGVDYWFCNPGCAERSTPILDVSSVVTRSPNNIRIELVSDHVVRMKGGIHGHLRRADPATTSKHSHESQGNE
jgi:YHS domain-containing protein